MSVDIAGDVFDEICLEGLDGITVPSLFLRLEARENASLKIDEFTKPLIWSIIVKLRCVEFYELAAERRDVVRMGSLPRPERILSDNEIYPICPVEDDNEKGSCKLFASRKIIEAEDVVTKTLGEMEECWGPRLVIVADLASRCKALGGDEFSPDFSNLIFPMDYVFLEFIGRCRHEGVMTAGQGSCQILKKDPRTVFYHINHLLNQKVVKKNSDGLLRIARYPEVGASTIETQVVEEFMKYPNYTMARDLVFQLFPDNTSNRLQKFFKKRRNNFPLMSLPFLEIYPDAVHDKRNLRRKVICIRYIPPESVENTGGDKDATPKTENKLNYLNYTPNSSGRRKVYLEILKASPADISIAELSAKLCIGRRAVGAYCKDLLAEKRLSKKILQRGKQNLACWCLSPSELKKPAVQLRVARIEASRAAEAPPPSTQQPEPDPAEAGPSTGETVVADVVDEVKKIVSTHLHSESSRKLWRMGLILNLIKERRAVLRHDIVRHIWDEEAKQGWKEKIDRKSLVRILEALVADGLLQIIQAEHTFYADPSVNPESVQSTDNIKNINIEKSIVERLHQMALCMESDMKEYLAQDKKVGGALVPIRVKQYLSAKFIRLSVLHDFLFYMVRGYYGDNSSGQDEMISQLSDSVKISDELRKELPTLYINRLSCYMFIPPDPFQKSVPGWTTFTSFLMNLPLSAFIKLVRVSFGSPELSQYVDDPVRCHYPMKLLSPSVRAGLLTPTHAAKILGDVRRLAAMGLLKFGPKPSRMSYTYNFYINQKACIIDTTTSEASYVIVEKKSYETLPFIFSSVADVKAYWVKLFNVCLETKLGRSRQDQKEENPRNTSNARADLGEFCIPIDPEEAENLDNGKMPGDQSGAGGLDSNLYSFARGNWISSNKLLARKEEPKKLEPKKMIDRKKSPPKAKKLATSKKKSKVKKELAPKIFYDKIDLDAKNKMMGMRVNWSPEEDNVLIFAKVSMDILNQPHRKIKSFLGRADIRSVLQRCVGVLAQDKTSWAVARRASILKRRSSFPSVKSLYAGLRCTPEIQKFVKRCPPEWARLSTLSDVERDQVISKGKTIFHEMVDFMIERYLQNGIIVQVQESDMPDTLDELNEFYEMPQHESDPHLDLKDIQEDSVRAVFLSCLASTSDKTSQVAHLFEVYRQFDEDLLKTSLQRLNQQKIITHRKRFEESKSPRLETAGAYQFSQRFKYLLNARYEQAVYHDAFKELNKLLSCHTDESLPVSLAGNSGTAMFALEASGHVTLTVQIPEQFIQLDTAKVAPQDTEKIMKRYRELQVDPTSVSSGLGGKRSLEIDDDDDDEDGPSAPKKGLFDDDSVLEEEMKDLCSVKVEDLTMEYEDEDFRTEPSADEGNRSGVAAPSARVALLLLREIASSVLSVDIKNKQIRRPIDIFVVTASKIMCTTNASLARDYSTKETNWTKKILNDIATKNTFPEKVSDAGKLLRDLCQKASRNEQIMIKRVAEFITLQGKEGALLKAIRDLGEGAAQAVSALESAGLVFRVGTYHPRLVWREYASNWAVRSFKLTRLQKEKMQPLPLSMSAMLNTKLLESNLIEINRAHDDRLAAASSSQKSPTPIQVLMRPWLRLDGSINRRVLDRMLGSVLGVILTAPGVNMLRVTEQFTPALTPVWTRELVKILEDIKCVRLIKVILQPKVTLFSKGSVQITEKLDGLETDEEILVEPLVDAMIKLGQFIGNKAYSKDIL